MPINYAVTRNGIMIIAVGIPELAICMDMDGYMRIFVDTIVTWGLSTDGLPSIYSLISIGNMISWATV